jgi:hypothetical protein
MNTTHAQSAWQFAPHNHRNGGARVCPGIAVQVRWRDTAGLRFPAARKIAGRGFQDDVNNSERAASVMAETAGCLMRRSAEMA